MKGTLFFFFAIAIFISASNAKAQSTRLSEAEYNSALAQALEGASGINRRVITEEKFYSGPTLTGMRNIVSEFAGPDAKRVEVTEDFGGKRSRSNYVKLSGQFFCREGDKGWKRADRDCAKKGQAMAIPDGKYEFFVEPDPNFAGRKIYTRRAAYTDAGSPDRDTARLKFIEMKFTADETGIITEYIETRRGGNEPNEWSSTQWTRYEYEPNGLRITDPTKEN